MVPRAVVELVGVAPGNQTKIGVRRTSRELHTTLSPGSTGTSRSKLPNPQMLKAKAPKRTSQTSLDGRPQSATRRLPMLPTPQSRSPLILGICGQLWALRPRRWQQPRTAGAPRSPGGSIAPGPLRAQCAVDYLALHSPPLSHLQPGRITMARRRQSPRLLSTV